jgi:hypothetical protein
MRQLKDKTPTRPAQKRVRIVCSQVSIVNDSNDVLPTRTICMKRSIGWHGRLPARWPDVRTVLRAPCCAMLATAFAGRGKGTQRSRGLRHGEISYLVASVGAPR